MLLSVLHCYAALLILRAVRRLEKMTESANAASSKAPPPELVQGIPTIPSILQEELDTNPFLRPNDPAIRKNLGEHLLFVF